MIEQVRDRLISLQNPDGGWGAAASRSSNTEATSLALSALRAGGESSSGDRVVRAALWLAARQNPDGGWRLNDVASAGSWTTALAIAALAEMPEHRQRAIAGAHWLLTQEGSKPGILAEMILWVTGKSGANRINRDLIGWSWVPRSFSWVEPTSYALLAIKKMKPALGETNAAERIEQGEAMIYDRMCAGGGWNYGNSKVLDYALWPYPDTTALALVALQDRAAETANRQSLHVLKKISQEANSGLACAWTAICLDLYGEPVEGWRKRVENRFRETGFLGETKTLALALIALAGKSGPFRL